MIVISVVGKGASAPPSGVLEDSDRARQGSVIPRENQERGKMAEIGAMDSGAPNPSCPLSSGNNGRGNPPQAGSPH